MTILEIIGFTGALLIGLILGLVGGGGSILTVPIFVYLLQINPITATAYSLFVVGSTALFGIFRNAKKKLVDFRTGIVFAIPSIITVFLTRKFLIPSIPEKLFQINSFVISKDMGIMLFFAIIMIFAAFSMLRKKSKLETNDDTQNSKFNYPLILIEGAIVGLITGIVGAGGGFLIIPALVLFTNLPMKKAVATSLLIVSAKSLIGFLGDVDNVTIDWMFLIGFTSISIIGIFLGIYLNQFINEKKLKKGFGFFILIMGVYIVLKETFFK